MKKSLKKNDREIEVHDYEMYKKKYSKAFGIEFNIASYRKFCSGIRISECNPRQHGASGVGLNGRH